MNIWLKAGKSAEYRDFGNDLEAAAKYLFAAGVRPDIEFKDSMSLVCPGFDENNAIHAFYGGSMSHHSALHGIYPKELKKINSFLKKMSKKSN